MVSIFGSMQNDHIRARIESIGMIPAVRVHSEQDAFFAGVTLFHSGIPVTEMTLTTPGALDAVSRLRTMFPEAIVGAGTVMNPDDARRALDAGASFITSPGFDPAIAAFAQEKQILFIPGALTPSELMAASRSCFGFVKIYPCSIVGGPAYIRTIKGSFPSIPLIAAGGVNQKTASDYLRAGAAVLGIGEDLVPHEAIEHRNETWIRELARRFIGIVHETRHTFGLKVAAY